MLIIQTREELKKWRSEQPERQSIGFVPTMGALHDGHLELVRQAQAENKLVVVSIFVNPLQFAPGEDFQKYPRLFKDDCALLEKENVDVVFYPSVENFYSSHFSTSVEETFFSKGLCGDFRPGHFKGVATVVLKLFNLIRPSFAYFGEKDFQQCLVIRKMVRDLDVNINIKIVPTIREPDGLAKSSRNRYLTPEQRKQASKIFELSKLLEQKLKQRAFNNILEAKVFSKTFLENAGFSVQYIEFLEYNEERGLEPAQVNNNAPIELFIAAYLGSTRLIDHFSLDKKDT